MKADAAETETLTTNMAALQTALTAAKGETERLAFLLEFMDNTHEDALEAIDKLIGEA